MSVCSKFGFKIALFVPVFAFAAACNSDDQPENADQSESAAESAADDPVAECGPEDCGPIPQYQPVLCSDGSFAHGSATCEANDDGDCAVVKVAPVCPFDPELFETSFKEASKGALFLSEADSEPTFFAIETGDRKLEKMSLDLAKGLLSKELLEIFTEESGDPITLSDLAYEWNTPDDSLEFLKALGEYTEDDEDYEIESAKAFAKVNDLLTANLTDIHLVLVGPKDEVSGEMAVDNGYYTYVVIGKTQDGNYVAGFTLGVVWT